MAVVRRRRHNRAKTSLILSVSDLTCYYQDEEWHALLEEDKIVILQARGTYRGGKAGAGDEKKPTSGVKHSVSAVQTATEAEEEEPSSEETVQAAGIQFGRHAHKKLPKRSGGGPAM